MKKHFLLMSSLLLSSAMAFGAAFQLNLQGARQLAMGGTGVASPLDASSIFYNPGGLSALKHVQGYVGVQALTSNIRYVETPTGTYYADSKPKTYTPFNLYIGGPINYKNRLSLGLGIYTPFGTGIKWDDNWRGRYVIQDIQLQSIFFQPTASYRVNDVISIGAGFIFATGNIKIQKAVPLQTAGQDGSVELKGDAMGYGYNVGVHMKATDWLQFGVSYRSGVKMKVKEGFLSTGYIGEVMKLSKEGEKFLIQELPQKFVGRLIAIEVFGRLYHHRESSESITESVKKHISF